MRKRYMILAGFILLKFILQYLLISPVYELHRDEYLHLDQGNHLARGFESVPPFTSWISWIILQLGNNEFWVKFFPALFGASTIFIAWKTVEELNGKLYALILCAVALTLSSLLRVNMLFQPNSFDILSWTLIFYLTIKYIKTGNEKWILWAGVAFGIAFLNKYNIIFLAAGLFPALLISQHRNIFLKRGIYFSALIAVIIMLPNLIWQYSNHFPVIHHMKELAETQLVNVNRADFLKEQGLVFYNSIFILIAALLAFFSYKPFRKYRFLFYSLIFILTLFTYLRAKGYYAFGLYPVLFAFGAVYLEYILRSGWKRFLKPILLLIIVLLFLLPVKLIYPLLSPEQIVAKNKKFSRLGLLRWEDGKEHELPQDFADMLGWKELAYKTDSVYKMAGKETTLVLCYNYGQAGAINYYSSIKNINAVSMNADYINWFDLNKKISAMILIQTADEEFDDRLYKLFKIVALKGQIENKYAREFGTKIWLLQEPKLDINAAFRLELKRITSR